MESIQSRYSAVQLRVHEACLDAAVSPRNVSLIAVGKQHPASALRALFELGQRDFAENYLQEALEKQHSLIDIPICWHFIGRIQRNKTRAIAENFDWVHSIDRFEVAQRMAQQRPSDRQPLNICLQVNIDHEDSKAGFLPAAVPEVATSIARLDGLRLRGLMAIPAANATSSQRLRSMQAMADCLAGLNTEAGLQLDTLSMGMSSDLEQAVAAGATMLRVGEALFGPRTPRH